MTLPAGIERDYPLARLTTVRAGGARSSSPGRRPRAELVELLAWARARGGRGRGRRLGLEPAGRRCRGPRPGPEAGRRARRDRARRATRVVCGGGARLPSAAAKAAGWGLAGLEFGINIPGTVGGAVRMNANAYGGELGARARVGRRSAPRPGPSAGAPGELGFAYRRSTLRPGEVVSRAAFALTEAEPAAVKAILAEMRGKRREAQPSGIKTFGSTFKNPDDPRAEGRTAGQLLDAAGCRGLAVGGARLSLKHANFVENTGSATHGRRARGDGRGSPPRARALRRRARARGPGARRGRVAAGLEARRRIQPRWADRAPPTAAGRSRSKSGAARSTQRSREQALLCRRHGDAAQQDEGEAEARLRAASAAAPELAGAAAAASTPLPTPGRRHDRGAGFAGATGS